MLSASSISWRAFSAASWYSAGMAPRENLLAAVAFEAKGLHGDQVDDADEAVAGAHGNLQRNDVEPELLGQVLANAFGIGTGAVHLVDEGDTRHAITLHLHIDGDRLALHAAHGAKHHDRAIEHAQRPFDLDGEVDVAGRVDQIDAAVAP